MRFINIAFAIIVVIVMVIFALNNTAATTVTFIPDSLAGIFPILQSVTLPLFVVVLGSVFLGLLIGFLWEYLREHKHRSEANKTKKEARRLERELETVRNKTGEGKDDILAIIE